MAESLPVHLIDTHCHIHDSEFYPTEREDVYRMSIEAGVTKMIVVGTDVRSSEEAIEFTTSHPGCFAVVGIHPHEAKLAETSQIRDLVEKHAKSGILVGIGEIGLDYHYDHSPREDQQQVFREQLEIARDFDLPVSFHVREAFDDFWEIVDDFPGIRGVVHSFTDTMGNAKKAIKSGLYIGINGISTFTKDETQKQMYKDIPIEKILLETDAPFLTPAPFRGKMNAPAYVGRVAEVQADWKGLSVSEVARITTGSAEELFNLKRR